MFLNATKATNICPLTGSSITLGMPSNNCGLCVRISRRDVKKKDKLAAIEIGTMKKIAADEKEDVSVTHEPDGDNRSHSGIWGVPREKRSLQEELAAEASRDLRLVVIPSGK